MFYLLFVRNGIHERVSVCPSLVLHGRGEDDLFALAQHQLVPLLDQRSERGYITWP